MPARELGADDRLRRPGARASRPRATSPPPTASRSPPRWSITSILFFVVARNRWGWSLAKAAAGRRRRCSLVDSAFLGRQHPEDPPRRLVPARSSRVVPARADGHVAPGPPARGRRASGGASAPSIEVLDEHADVAVVRGHRRVPLQGRRQGAAGAGQQPAPQQGPATSTPSSSPSRPTDAPHVDGDERGDRRDARGRACTRSSCASASWRSPTCPPRSPPSTIDGAADRPRRRHLLRRPGVGDARATSRACTPPLEHLYTLLHRGADSASRFFNLPPDRVFEVGRARSRSEQWPSRSGRARRLGRSGRRRRSSAWRAGRRGGRSRR